MNLNADLKTKLDMDLLPYPKVEPKSESKMDWKWRIPALIFAVATLACAPKPDPHVWHGPINKNALPEVQDSGLKAKLLHESDSVLLSNGFALEHLDRMVFEDSANYYVEYEIKPESGIRGGGASITFRKRDLKITNKAFSE